MKLDILLPFRDSESSSAGRGLLKHCIVRPPHSTVGESEAQGDAAAH